MCTGRGHGVNDLPTGRLSHWYSQREGLLQCPVCLLGGDIKTRLANTVCPGALKEYFPPSLSLSPSSLPLFLFSPSGTQRYVLPAFNSMIHQAWLA